MNTINQIIEEQDDIFDGRIEGGDFDHWKTREIDPQEIKIYIHTRDKAILEGVIEMIKEKLRIINDYPLYNDFVKGEKSACREILQHLIK